MPWRLIVVSSLAVEVLDTNLTRSAKASRFVTCGPRALAGRPRWRLRPGS
jgi:hypothetical protein